jgi:hypothetical protein
VLRSDAAAVVSDPTPVAATELPLPYAVTQAA